MYNYLHITYTHCNQILYSIRYTTYRVLIVFEILRFYILSGYWSHPTTVLKRIDQHLQEQCIISHLDYVMLCDLDVHALNSCLT